tara:strand:- start:332 stop:781 length:450 start_codon:yes stop_codon:yes gene_type:complete
MKSLFTNPFVIIGSVLGAYYLIKQKPESRGARTLRRAVQGGEQVATQLGDFGTSAIDIGVDTTKDILSIYDNEEVVDFDGMGLDGADGNLAVFDADNDPDPVGFSGNDSKALADLDETTGIEDLAISGKSAHTSRGFSGATLDMNNFDY